ncbi:eIF5-mimic protein 2 isoform X1 [Dermacentor albipictus]|uniref:eIF5-mimic protein 2 isoform X1 n=2 Tax=Dermacentor albipictus TaxID=60249 RepID=UPI0031FBA5FF
MNTCFCMSQKPEKPTLSGQRIKTRKRDEKEKYDPSGFRDAILQGFAEAGSDLDAVHKFLDAAGSKLDYRRYGEVIFDILLAGGILAPGGTLIVDLDTAKPSQTDTCVFSAPNNMEVLRSYAQLITKLIRRYKYLEKTLEEEFKKVLMFLKGFSAENRQKLARVLGVLIAGGQVSASVLQSALQDHLVKDGLALQCLLDVLQTWLEDRDPSTLWAVLRKAGFDSRLMEFFPVSKRSPENFTATFKAHGVSQLLDYQKAQEASSVKKDLQQQVSNMLKNEVPVKEIIQSVKEYMTKYSLPEHDVAVLLWTTQMSGMDWNKKEELVADQALKHLKQYTPLLEAFTTTPRAEVALLVKVQEFCYDNMNFMKVFQKIVILFYKTDVLSEDSILKWYKGAHSPKGKSVFLDQMKRFVEWLQNAEEESEGED